MISYMLFTVRGDILDSIVDLGEHIFEGVDYAFESVNDLYIIGPGGIPVRINAEEFIPPTVLQTQKNISNLVFFYLYTRNNPSNYQQLNVNDTDTLQNSNFNVSKYTTLYVHGWMTKYTSAAGIRNGMRLFIEKN